MIRSRWTFDHYREFLASLLGRGLRPLDVAQFGERRPGFWLRHDVELSLDAAIAMAAIEAELGIPSSYFVCVESPFFADAVALTATVDHLSRLHRDVSFHLLLSTRTPPIEDRVGALAQRFPAIEPRALTFHAPGVDVAELATMPLGAIVYRPMVDQSVRYFSDSTGRWRWGDPVHADLDAGDLIQILTHPFWWSGGDVPAEVASDQAGSFLPQFSATAEATQSVAPDQRSP